MQHLRSFVASEGDRYQQLELASADLAPRCSPEAIEDGLDGWSFMMRTADRGLALLYFEQKAVAPRVGGLTPGACYRWTWFDVRTGSWIAGSELAAGADGVLAAPPFPDGAARAAQDWAARLKQVPTSRGRH